MFNVKLVLMTESIRVKTNNEKVLFRCYLYKSVGNI